MPSCVLCGKSRNFTSISSGITFHRLPLGPVQAEWIKFAMECGIHASMLKPLNSLFCSEHFSKNCFERYIYNTLLKQDAVPSIKIQRKKYAKVVYHKKPILVKKNSINSSTNKSHDDIRVLSSQDNPIDNRDPITTSPDVPDESIKTLQKVYDNKYVWISEQDAISKVSLPKCVVSKLVAKNASKSKDLKYLKYKLKRQKRKIASMKRVIKSLKQSNLLKDDELKLFTEKLGAMMI